MSQASYDMTPEELRALIADFLTESESHLHVLNAKLLESETAVKNGKDMSDDDLNAMFRAAHTIKGTASFIGLSKVMHLTHEMETILQRVKNRVMPLTLEIINVLFHAFDTLEALFSDLKERGEEVTDTQKSVGEIKALLGPETGKEKQKASVAPEPKKEPAPEEIKQTEVKPAETGFSGKKDTKTEKDARGINIKYLEQYIVETEQNIDVFNELMVSLEKKKNVDAVNELFRIVHTIKGSSGILNIPEIMEISHSMENILAIVRQKKFIPQPAVITKLFNAIDLIKDCLSVLKENKVIEFDKVMSMCIELNQCCETLPVSPAPEKQPEIRVSSPVAVDQDDHDKLVDLKNINDDEWKNVVQMVSDGGYVFKIVFKVAQNIPLKDMKAMLAVEKLSKKGNLVSVKPDLKTITGSEKTDLYFGVLFCSIVDEKEIRFILSIDGIEVKSIERQGKSDLEGEAGYQKVFAVPDKVTAEVPKGGKTMIEQVNMKKPDMPPTAGAPIELSTIKIDSKKLDNLMNLSGELVIIRAQFARLLTLFNSDIIQQKEMAHLMDRTKSLVDGFSHDMKKYISTVEKTESAKGKKFQKALDNLDENLSDLERKFSVNRVIVRVHELDQTTNALEKIASAIQAGVMQTRMIPIEGVFTRFKRIVRDISKEIGKEVNLEIAGESTELDKKLVDSLGDPLTHMIRNAVDHGIEDKEERVKAGKPEIGTVFLKASHQGNNICIEVSDDGKGIDVEKVGKIGVEKGIITDEDRSRMSDKDKLNLIFLPGFSTATKVTGLSGRGVGMDVVKNMITSVNGTVDINTEVGKGTTFVLKIPLTLAIIQALLVVTSGETYAIPLEAVTEIIKVSEDEIYLIDGNPTVKLRGHALSLVDLEVAIKSGVRSKTEEKTKKVVIITDGEGKIGVIVDSLIGEEEIVIKSLTEHFGGVKSITGASILADGSVALIIDPVTIIRESKED